MSFFFNYFVEDWIKFYCENLFAICNLIEKGEFTNGHISNNPKLFEKLRNIDKRLRTTDGVYYTHDKDFILDL